MKIDNLQITHILLLGMLPATVFSSDWGWTPEKRRKWAQLHRENGSCEFSPPPPLTTSQAMRRRGWTALDCAIYDGDLVKVEFLIEHGAEVNPKENKISPLHIAVQKKHKEMVELLIKHGADVNVDKHVDVSIKRSGYRIGMPPLFLAIHGDDLGMVKLLIEHGADVNMKDYQGETPLDVARSEEIKKLLRKHGAISGN